MTSNRLSSNLILDALEGMLGFGHLYCKSGRAIFASLVHPVDIRAMARDLTELPASEITRPKVKEIVGSYLREALARTGPAEKVQIGRNIYESEPLIYENNWPVCTELEFERFVNGLMSELKVDGWYGL